MDEERGSGLTRTELTPEEVRERKTEKKNAEQCFQEEKFNQALADKKQAIVLQSICIQGQMEGLFRQLYQACTQQMMTSQFGTYEAMMITAGTLFEDLREVFVSFEALAKGNNEPNGPVN